MVEQLNEEIAPMAECENGIGMLGNTCVLLMEDKPCICQLLDEIEELREANGAALAVLPTQRNPTNDLQRLVNIAVGMLRLDPDGSAR